MAVFAKHYLHPTAMSPTLADRRQLNTTTPSGGVDTGTSVQYGAGGTGWRQFRPGTANETTISPIPSANAVPTNKWGWRNPADLTADKVVTIAGNWPVSARFTLTGQSSGPTGQLGFVAYLVSGGVDTTYTEIGRFEVPTGATWTGGVVSGDLPAAAVTGPVGSRVEIHIYLLVTVAHVGVGSMTVAVSTNSADSFLGPGTYTRRAERTFPAGLSLTGVHRRILTHRRSRSAGLSLTAAADPIALRRRSFAGGLSLTAARRLVVKPAARQATLSLTAVHQPKRVTLARAGMRAGLTLTPSLTKRTIKQRAASLVLSPVFDRNLIMRQSAVAGLSLTGRMFVTLGQQVLNRMTGGGGVVQVIRKFFSVWED